MPTKIPDSRPPARVLPPPPTRVPPACVPARNLPNPGRRTSSAVRLHPGEHPARSPSVWEEPMSREANHVPARLAGHALRNANLRTRALLRAREAPPLARALVTLRAQVLGMTRLEFAHRAGIGRSTLRDVELGLHTPTRRTLQQFAEFCRSRGVNGESLDEVYRLYAGSRDGLGPWLARLETRAGSPAALARKAGLSPATLWEYRRGNFPLPLKVLRRLCEVTGEDPGPAEALWYQAERQRLLA